MNDGLIPRRYAKALLKFAIEKRQADRLYAMMKTLSTNFVDEPDLAKTVSNPFVPAADKTKLLMTAAGATAADDVYADFLKLLINNNRIDMMRAIAMAYLEMYRKANNIYLVEITSAAPMPGKELKRLKALIESHVAGATVEYHIDVDPDLIGGFVVKIDSERLDASIKNELKQLRLKLLGK